MFHHNAFHLVKFRKMNIRSCQDKNAPAIGHSSTLVLVGPVTHQGGQTHDIKTAINILGHTFLFYNARPPTKKSSDVFIALDKQDLPRRLLSIDITN